MSNKNLLKLMSIVLVAMLSVGFTSCGNDDDDELSSNSIVGHWKGVTFQKYDDINLTNLIDEGESSWDWRFYDDGTCSCRGYESALNGIYKLLGNEVNIYKSNRTDYFETYYIIEFSKERMKIKYKWSSNEVYIVVMEKVN